jgi:hypothetical protein
MVFQELSDALAWLGLPPDFITHSPAEAKPDAVERF